MKLPDGTRSFRDFTAPSKSNALRKNKPFVTIKCFAFSHDFLESEMFDHKSGAFTGAVKDKKGLFEEANGGNKNR